MLPSAQLPPLSALWSCRLPRCQPPVGMTTTGPYNGRGPRHLDVQGSPADKLLACKVVVTAAFMGEPSAMCLGRRNPGLKCDAELLYLAALMAVMMLTALGIIYHK